MSAREAVKPRSGGRSARRRAREYALQGLYQWLVGGQDVAAIEGHLMETEGFDKADVAHFREVLHGATEGADALRAEFARFIDRDIKELSPVEHAILLIGAYELKHRQEIPYRVVINEAVELAKSFGGTEGFKYVNGVLDKVAAALRPHETGR
ncbi:transcription antitermination factor NusB [Betaproteobacteria bacterium PRO7]|jgi:N utilization substance protein B|nr:transcription antitermination factor NusB [Burkholderiaceae bacterium]MDL1861139.1 transcription antitermination factor NusB [Betaproteobacteria bacterium PRO7]GIL05612.1 MAG: N utilization substance protein B [Betaproteobacteria bacterium]